MTGDRSTTLSGMGVSPGSRRACVPQCWRSSAETWLRRASPLSATTRIPGSHMRDLVRDIMNFHVHGLTDPKQRIGQARAILKFVSEGSEKKKRLWPACCASSSNASAKWPTRCCFTMISTREL